LGCRFGFRLTREGAPLVEFPLAFARRLWLGGFAGEAGEDFGRGCEEVGFAEWGAEAGLEAVEAEDARGA
jgi:hypothetical protein